MFNSLLKTDYINNLQNEAKLSKIKENRDIYNKYFLIIDCPNLPSILTFLLVFGLFFCNHQNFQLEQEYICEKHGICEMLL